MGTFIMTGMFEASIGSPEKYQENMPSLLTHKSFQICQSKSIWHS